MKRDREGAPVWRAAPGRIGVDLPRWVTELVATAAEGLRRTCEHPGTEAFNRLYSRVEETGETEDPIVMLTRQTMLDEVAGTVVASIGKPVISDEEAEAWLKVLGMLLASRAAELGVVTEEQRDALGTSETQFFDVVHALQLCLIEALDGPLEH